VAGGRFRFPLEIDRKEVHRCRIDATMARRMGWIHLHLDVLRVESWFQASTKCEICGLTGVPLPKLHGVKHKKLGIAAGLWGTCKGDWS